MIVRLANPPICPWNGGYSGHGIRLWPAGESREVDDATATYLLETFPRIFLRVEDPEPEPPVPDPVLTPDEAGLERHPPPGVKAKSIVKLPKRKREGG